MRLSVLLLLSACSLAESAEPRRVEPFGAVTRSRPALGRYLTEVHHAESAFITMEMTTAASVDGQLRLDLGSNGRARMCTVIRRSDSGSIGRYASPDGEDHHHESAATTERAWAGTWAASPDLVILTLRPVYGGCDADPDPAAPVLPPVRCVSLETSDLPGPAVACAMPASDGDARYPAPALTSGPGDGPRPPGQWLVFGAGTGLKLTISDDHRYGSAPSVSWEVAKVSWEPRQWQVRR